MQKPTEVFGPLAHDYARYRPGYPTQVREELERICRMTCDWSIADIGSGTGNLARIFLQAGYQVAGVEPNREMREAAEHLLAAYPTFHSIDGSAESTHLDNQSVDLITVGQALPWFDIDQALAEFHRILRPDGWVAVMWNNRLSDTTPFTRAYAELTRQLADACPPPTPPRPFDGGLGQIFGATPRHSAQFKHTQPFDLQGLLGRARSSGFIPQPGNPGHEEHTALLTELFTDYQQSGIVEFHYITELHFGHMR